MFDFDINKPYKEVIVCAATSFSYMDGDSEVEFKVACVRHHESYYDPRVIELKKLKVPLKVVEGFFSNKLDQTTEFPTYRFYDRVSALKIAIESNQNLRREDIKDPESKITELYSEWLY